MKAYRVVFSDKELFGQIIPKEFVEFAFNFTYQDGQYDENIIPNNQKMINSALFNTNKSHLKILNTFLKHALSAQYSDDQLVQLWRESCYAAFCYYGEAQRKFMQEMHNAIGLYINK